MAEIQVFVGESYVVTVRHGEAGALKHVRAAIERDLERIRCGPMAVLHAVTDRVVDDYAAVVAGLDNDMAEIEESVFTSDRPRSEEHTSELQSLMRNSYAVFCLKKKKNKET